jgi:hypothetical protein
MKLANQKSHELRIQSMMFNPDRMYTNEISVHYLITRQLPGFTDAAHTCMIEFDQLFKYRRQSL